MRWSGVSDANVPVPRARRGWVGEAPQELAIHAIECVEVVVGDRVERLVVERQDRDDVDAPILARRDVGAAVVLELLAIRALRARRENNECGQGTKTISKSPTSATWK